MCNTPLSPVGGFSLVYKLETGTSARATFHSFHALQLVFSVAEQMQRRNFLRAGGRLRPRHTASLPQSRPEDTDCSFIFF